MISFIVGWLFMPSVIRIAQKHNFVVSPNKRTSHNGLVPNVGGIDIFFSFFAVILLSSFTASIQSQFVMIGLFVIMVVGFIDDLLDIDVFWKLIGETAAAFCLIVIADVRLSSLHGFLGIYEIPLIFSYLLSYFVFIVITNSLNLVDGIDGLASGLGILYSLFFGIYFYRCGSMDLPLSLFAFTLVGSLAVFFIYNVFGNKKKIFMGDSGSLLLGYLVCLFVSEFCEMNAYHTIPDNMYMSAAPVVAICILSVPLFDTVRVMLTRVKKKQSPFKPDKNHIHHLLLSLGLRHWQVSATLLTVSILYIVLAIVARNWPIWMLLLLYIISATFLTYVLWRLVDRKRMKGEKNNT
ncbi:MAG: undecaprenyl/decaprenyl-phosphate alpha-N-acetylglucosaminyl 1-phosphate transferase [Prevotellaceae bacterium]|nr:undecaprenyl/decaprenyl-phosphate alpha-N-acetylglucosaminyl 1-phosphate transferase [Prevotellaceae bacterium]